MSFMTRNDTLEKFLICKWLVLRALKRNYVAGAFSDDESITISITQVSTFVLVFHNIYT